jgi:1-acyl-sn-glycerol-3-phosphate acyltransferase
MVAVRSALYLAILVAYTPLHWVACALAAPLPRLVRWRVIAAWPQLATWLARHLLGIDYEVLGRDNIPREPCVILSKHQSAWETIAYTSIFPPHVYVIKRELLWIPFLGWGLALMSPIAINRADRKRAMQRLIEQGRERFRQGFSIMVYPEGTRIAVGRRGVYKLGGAVIAVSTGACVLPVAHNAGLVWPRNSFLKHPGKVTVVVGPPIDSAGLTAEELMRRAEDWIEGEMERLTPPEAIARSPASKDRAPREASDRRAAALAPALSAKVGREGDEGV